MTTTNKLWENSKDVLNMHSTFQYPFVVAFQKKSSLRRRSGSRIDDRFRRKLFDAVDQREARLVARKDDGVFVPRPSAKLKKNQYVG